MKEMSELSPESFPQHWFSFCASIPSDICDTLAGAACEELCASGRLEFSACLFSMHSVPLLHCWDSTSVPLFVTGSASHHQSLSAARLKSGCFRVKIKVKGLAYFDFPKTKTSILHQTESVQREQLRLLPPHLSEESSPEAGEDCFRLDNLSTICFTPAQVACCAGMLEPTWPLQQLHC